MTDPRRLTLARRLSVSLHAELAPDALEADLDDLLAMFVLPEPIRLNLRTTNLIERAFRELRRRIRPMGALADRRSTDRILYGQVLRLNDLLARRP